MGSSYYHRVKDTCERSQRLLVERWLATVPPSGLRATADEIEAQMHAANEGRPVHETAIVPTGRGVVLALQANADLIAATGFAIDSVRTAKARFTVLRPTRRKPEPTPAPSEA